MYTRLELSSIHVNWLLMLILILNVILNYNCRIKCSHIRKCQRDNRFEFPKQLNIYHNLVASSHHFSGSLMPTHFKQCLPYKQHNTTSHNRNIQTNFRFESKLKQSHGFLTNSQFGLSCCWINILLLRWSHGCWCACYSLAIRRSVASNESKYRSK